MRLALLPFGAIALGGCLYDATPRSCAVDDDCSGEVCAANHYCAPRDEVRDVTTTWTVAGMPANVTTCATTPTLWLGFERSGTHDGFVFRLELPCETGVLLVENVRTEFDRVVMGIPGSRDAFATIDIEGRAAVDF